MVSKAIGGQHEKKIYGNGDFIFVTEGVGEEGNNHDIYVCEGIEDALSFTSVGCKAVSLNSLSNLNSFKNHIMDNLAAYSGYRIIMVFDHDLAGERATNDFKQFLQEQGIVCYKCEFPKNFKDINQYWVSKVFEKGGV
jgi:5S rRNA maturation endonuclease (ribonuclease M5)